MHQAGLRGKEPVLSITGECIELVLLRGSNEASRRDDGKNTKKQCIVNDEVLGKGIRGRIERVQRVFSDSVQWSCFLV